MMKVSHRRTVSLATSRDAQRLRLDRLEPGAQLVPLGAPLDVLGTWHRGSQLTAYVAGPMPPELRTACEEARTEEEEWFVPIPAGIQEIDLTDCRYDYLVRQPKVVPMYPLLGEVSDAQQAA